MAVAHTSDLIKKRHRHRGIYGGKDYDVAGRIFLPAGTTVASGDDLLFVPVGENQIITKVTLTNTGTSITGSIGIFQMLDAQGNPVVVERDGPSRYAPDDTRFTSPETNATFLAAAGAKAGYAEFLTPAANVEKLAGPVNVGMRLTAAFTAAEDTELFLAVYFDGEKSMRESTGGYPGRNNDYLLG